MKTFWSGRRGALSHKGQSKIVKAACCLSRGYEVSLHFSPLFSVVRVSGDTLSAEHNVISRGSSRESEAFQRQSGYCRVRNRILRLLGRVVKK